jgi:cytoskeletal protein CcmA (bactofilin family)
VWNKQRSDEGYAPRPQLEPNRPAAPVSAPAPTPVAMQRPEPPAAARQSATIGASMTIKGEISSREELIIDGEVDGAVESHSVLTVGPNGKVRANIKAREVVVYGSVRGNVEVAEKIAIREQGSLVGDIKAAGISIDDGAYFKGSIDIVRPEPKVTTKVVQSEPRMEAHAG